MPLKAHIDPNSKDLSLEKRIHNGKWLISPPKIMNGMFYHYQPAHNLSDYDFRMTMVNTFKNLKEIMIQLLKHEKL